MKFVKITKRDIKIFLLGMLAMLALATVYDWENNWSEFQRGFNESRGTSRSN